MNKARPLEEMFGKVPRRYDLLNRLLTWRLDEKWRRLAAKKCLEENPKRVLDLCCGTGDLARHLAKVAENPPSSPRKGKLGTKIIGVDFVPGMLELARHKVPERVEFLEGDAAALPFPDDHFEAIGIAFAFRNLTWKNPRQPEYLKEIARVLSPQGRLVIVETSQPANPLVRWLFHLYLRGFAAPLGRLLSDHAPAYSYLAESAAGFYSPGELASLLREVGLQITQHRALLLGCAAVSVVQKDGV